MITAITIFHFSGLFQRNYLDKILAQALSLPLAAVTETYEVQKKPMEKQSKRKTKFKTLKIIDENNYVLTLDYALKMINIHERRECGMPIIIEGETGVGKTALIRMLSKLWNFSWEVSWADMKVELIQSLNRIQASKL